MNRPHASDQDDQDAAEEGSHGAHSPPATRSPRGGPHVGPPRGQRLGVGAGPRGAAVTPDAGRRQSKMGSAIEVLWKSWDDLDGGGGGEDPDGRPRGVHGHGPGADAALLAASASRKSRLTPYSPTQPRSPFQPRRPSTTLWDLKDLKDARSSPRSPLSLSRSPLSTGLGAAAAAAAASLGAEHTGIKVYKRRWLMLAIFIFLGITNTFQWVQYSIIARIVQRYYNVKSFYVDLTCTSFLIAYLLCFIPASWYLDRHGLRWTLIVAAGLTSLGSWVKVGSVGRDRFWVTMVGQVVVAVGQVFMLFLPPRLASVWFGPDQVSLACSLGFIGILMGNAAGMLLPPLLVPNSDDIAQVGADLRSMFLGMAACTTASLVIQLACEDPLPLPLTGHLTGHHRPLTWALSVPGGAPAAPEPRAAAAAGPRGRGPDGRVLDLAAPAARRQAVHAGAVLLGDERRRVLRHQHPAEPARPPAPPELRPGGGCGGPHHDRLGNTWLTSLRLLPGPDAQVQILHPVSVHLVTAGLGRLYLLTSARRHDLGPGHGRGVRLRDDGRAARRPGVRRRDDVPRARRHDGGAAHQRRAAVGHRAHLRRRLHHGARGRRVDHGVPGRAAAARLRHPALRAARAQAAGRPACAAPPVPPHVHLRAEPH